MPDCFEDVYEEELDKWIGLIMYAAQRYEMPSRADQEDLTQVGRIALEHAIQEHGYLNDADWERMVKTIIFHSIESEVNKNLAECRDVRKEVSADKSVEDSEGNDRQAIQLSGSRHDDPLKALMHRVDITTLIPKLDKDERILLNEIMNPSDEMVRAYEKSLEDSGKGAHTCPPNYVYADALKWDQGYVGTVRQRLRIKIAEHLGFHDLASKLRKEPDNVFIEGQSINVAKVPRVPKVYIRPKERVDITIRTVYCNECGEVLASVKSKPGEKGNPVLSEARRKHREATGHRNFSVGNYITEEKGEEDENVQP